MRAELEADHDIAGEHYAALIDFARDHGGLFSVVLRYDVASSAHAEDLFRRFADLSIRCEVVSQWPGTMLCGPSSTQLALCPFTDATVQLLRESADSVFSWCQPGLPEDLAFYNQAGQHWFVAIAHEHYWLVDGEQVDGDALVQAVPLRFYRPR